MKNKLIILFYFFFSLNSYCQNITLVKDSILNNYKRSGFCAATFIDSGEKEFSRRKGFWKIYDWAYDYVYIVKDKEQNPISGNYWFYEEGEYVDGKKNGNWDYYVVEDITFKKILHKQLNFNNGVSEGKYNYFHLNKKIAREGTWLNLKQNGIVKTYYENGKLKRTEFYKNNLREGKSVDFYLNRKVQLERNYKNNTINGVCRVYHDKGQLWTERIYNNGLIMNVSFNYDVNGNKKEKGTLKDGNGTLLLYNKKGMLITKITCRDGLKISEKNF